MCVCVCVCVNKYHPPNYYHSGGLVSSDMFLNIMHELRKCVVFKSHIFDKSKLGLADAVFFILLPKIKEKIRSQNFPPH